MGITNLASFNASLDKFADKIEGRSILFQKKVAFLVLGAFVQQAGGGFSAVSGLLQLTPVDTGRAVGNWQVTIGAPAAGTIDSGFGKAKGSGANRASAEAGASRRALSGVSGLRFGQSIWITNNLPYIVVLNDGGVNRTAHHMLERALDNARRSIRSA